MNPLVHIILEALAELGILKAGETWKGSGPGKGQQESESKAVEISEGIATKADVDTARVELEREIGAHVGEVKAEIGARAATFETQIGQCRADIGHLKAETDKRLSRLESNLAEIRQVAKYVLWIGAGILTISFISAAKYLFF